VIRRAVRVERIRQRLGLRAVVGVILDNRPIDTRGRPTLPRPRASRITLDPRDAAEVDLRRASSAFVAVVAMVFLSTATPEILTNNLGLLTRRNGIAVRNRRTFVAADRSLTRAR
jgi:hypothetical protein